MNTEPELLNERLERLAIVLDEIMPQCALLVRDALELLKEKETVLRCKDCKWYDERISMCDNCGLPREQTFFCADGKRRIDNA